MINGEWLIPLGANS